MPKTSIELAYQAKYRRKHKEQLAVANAEYQRAHRTETNLKTRKWQLQNKEYFRERHILRSYGLTTEDLRRMLWTCGFRCVCGIQIDEHTRHIDHDHATNTVRGLLCQNCNRALGMVQEKPETLEALLVYLRNGGR